MSRALLLLPWILLLSAVPCAAEVQVSFPLEGYYRAGRYMPVRVVARGEAAAELTLSADGAVPVVLQLGGSGTDAIVPLLIVREPTGPITWSLRDGRSGRLDSKLIPLGEHDRLVGFSGAGADSASPLFADKKIVAVALDLTQPLRGPVTAWEALDAIVLDRPAFEIYDVFLSAGGTALVVRSATQPEAGWLPWRRVADAWVIAQDPLGPRGAIVPEAYDPAYGWKPGRPPALRRQVVLLAVVFAIIAVAVTLWRSRFAAVALIAVSAAATGALMLRAARQSAVVSAGGSVLVRRGGSFQAEDWTYFKSLAPTAAEISAGVTTKPVFASVAHFERSGLKLVCDVDGLPIRFTLPLAPGASVAFLTRMPIQRNEDPRPDPAAHGSPLWPLVRRGYLGPGARALGEVPAMPRHVPVADEESWSDIVVEELTP